LSDYYQSVPVPGADRLGSIVVRRMTHEDGVAFPASCRTSLRVSDGFSRRATRKPQPHLASTLRPDVRARRLVAVEADGDVVGVAGAFPGSGWSSHVAELRVLVSATCRRRGIGRELARAALVEALDLGCSQAYVEVVAEQEALVAMFQDMGFEPAALLPDFVRDGAGDFHDLMLLTHRTHDQWGIHYFLGLEELST
jgi:L-amino acid N-acyltransferase YncA